jgi:acyl-CoA synthetase (AMP-forming)/AMP-acid ligase II
VWIDGRVSSMINRGGLKVFPDEVEEHLREFPGVRDAAVAGVPDERLGEVPWAFLVVAPGTSLDADTLRTWCRERMAPYKIRPGVTILERAPSQRDRQAACAKTSRTGVSEAAHACLTHAGSHSARSPCSSFSGSAGSASRSLATGTRRADG